jgi:hypothetical protein
MSEDALRPDAVEDTSGDDTTGPAVLQPTKLIRIASMTRAMLDEVRQAPLDEAGRQRLVRVHDRSLAELEDVLSPDLLDEFHEIFEPISDTESVPTEPELRIAQAQLIGWLEGLFHGIQASLFSQQMAAQAQLAEMQRRQLSAGHDGQPAQAPGLYL